MSTLVNTRQLTKIYQRGPEKVEVLHGIDLEIPKGDFIALMGPSGSGKTTLPNLIGGRDTPPSGNITTEVNRQARTRWGPFSNCAPPPVCSPSPPAPFLPARGTVSTVLSSPPPSPPPCSLLSAHPTAATVRARPPCPISVAERRFTRVRAAGSRTARSARSAVKNQ